MTTEELLEKYFEGKTSCEEEKQLRHLFTEGDVPQHLQVYRPMFAYLENESQNCESRKQTVHVPQKYHRSRLRHIAYLTTGLAAGVLLVLGIARMESLQTASQNYVIINGQQYTDTKLAKAKALEALQNVSFTDEDLNELLFQH